MSNELSINLQINEELQTLLNKKNAEIFQKSELGQQLIDTFAENYEVIKAVSGEFDFQELAGLDKAGIKKFLEDNSGMAYILLMAILENCSEITGINDPSATVSNLSDAKAMEKALNQEDLDKMSKALHGLVGESLAPQVERMANEFLSQLVVASSMITLAAADKELSAEEAKGAAALKSIIESVLGEHADDTLKKVIEAIAPIHAATYAAIIVTLAKETKRIKSLVSDGDEVIISAYRPYCTDGVASVLIRRK